MYEDIIKSHWREIKGKIKQQWNKLTDEDVASMKGSFEELTAKLQKTYGYPKEEAKREILRFLERNGLIEDE